MNAEVAELKMRLPQSHPKALSGGALKRDLLKTLGSGSGERKILQFLKRNPELVLWAFVETGGHSRYVISEFPFGSDYRADFVVAFAVSGRWIVHFVELEPPDDKVFTKA